MRGAFYVDGFNFYHALDELKMPYLKWLNLRKLAEILARGHARTIERVVFCTAVFPDHFGKKNDFSKKKRHQHYIDALIQYNVDVINGHFTKELIECKLDSCGYQWDVNREKASDINLALSLFNDAVKNVFDVAFLISADTDQVATLKFMRKNFPQKRVFVIAPHGRIPSKHLRDFAHGTIKMTLEHLDESVLPSLINQNGFKAIIRPHEYDPPSGWVHPDNRP